MKRGQLTIFMIIGIILVVLVALVVVFREQITEKTETVITSTLSMSKEARQVQQDMTACMKELGETAIVVMSLQGGYVELGNVQHTNTTSKINYLLYSGTAYAYYKGKNTVPTKEAMEKEISDFIKENSIICKKNYEDMEVTYGSIEPSAKIGKDSITITATTPVQIKKGESQSDLNSVSTKIAVRLGTVQDVLNQIVEEQLRISPKEVCLSCITRIAAENDVEISIDRIGDDIFYMIFDEKSKLGNANFIFITANRF